MTDDWRDDELDPTISAACGVLTTTDHIPAIRVVTRRRPTYHELARWREHAAIQQIHLTVDGRGMVTLRRQHNRGIRESSTQRATRRHRWRRANDA